MKTVVALLGMLMVLFSVSAKAQFTNYDLWEPLIKHECAKLDLPATGLRCTFDRNSGSPDVEILKSNGRLTQQMINYQLLNFIARAFALDAAFVYIRQSDWPPNRFAQCFPIRTDDKILIIGFRCDKPLEQPGLKIDPTLTY